MEKLETLAGHIKAERGAAIRSSRITHGELTLDVSRDKIVDVLKFLRDDKSCLFEVLIDICGVDWPARSNRFDHDEGLFPRGWHHDEAATCRTERGEELWSATVGKQCTRMHLCTLVRRLRWLKRLPVFL